MLQQPNSSGVLIGRRAELDALRQRLQAAGQGHGSVVLINGEAGIGKSRLVEEVSRQARSILRGNCFEPDRALPFAPVIDLLRSCFSGQSPADTVASIGPDGAELARLLPELAFLSTGTSSSQIINSEQEKHRLFQALTHFVERVAASPLLLVIEDLHWSDDTSLEFLLHLARRTPRLPVLMLATYRPDETQPGLRSFLAASDRERLASEISLRPLTIDEVDWLLRKMFGQPHPIRPDFLRELYELTQGNAFFIEEIVGALIASGDIYRSGGRWDRKALPELGIPRSVRHAVVRRTEQLDPEAREVLRIAAVAGQRFSFTVLLEITGLNEETMIRIIRELVAAQLVIEESAERFAFRHALTRQAVYGELLARERQWIHRRLGETIESLHTDARTTPLSDLAYHFHAAGAWEKALQFAPLAGRRAQELYAPRAAAEHFSRALDASRCLSLVPDPDLLRARGMAYATLGEFERARRDYESVLDQATAQGNRRMEWQAHFDLGCLWLGYEYGTAGSYFERALGLARGMEDQVLVARSLLQLGNWQVNTEQLVEAERSLSSALEIFEEIDDRPAIAETVDLLGVVADISGNMRVMRAYQQRANQLYLAIDDRRGVSSTLVNIAAATGGGVYDVSAAQGDMTMEDVSRHIDEALEIARDINWRAGEAYALVNLALQLTHRGIYGRGIDAFNLARVVADEIEHREWLTAAHLEEGMRYLDLLDHRRSRAAFERAHELAEESGSGFFGRLSAGMLATACIADGAYCAAQAALKRYDPHLPMHTVGQRWIWFARANLALAASAPDDALQIADRLFRFAPGLTDRREMPRVGYLEGKALAALGRTDEAEAALETAAGCAAEREMRPLLWRIHLSLGDLYRHLGRKDAAHEHYQAARNVLDEIGMTIPDEELRSTFIERALSRFPADSISTSARAQHSLTRREQDVALLVARGMTNREIAGALHVGERTVETHVSNVLGKLGFTSRTQIATWVLETGLTATSGPT